MKLRLCRLLEIAAFVSCVLGNAQSLARNAYITNDGSGNVSAIDTATNKVTAAIPVGANPFGVAVIPDGSTVYVANARYGANTVSAIATADE
jgi:YVTN family beta-propeller protein